MDAFLNASPSYRAARATCVRDRHAPVYLPRELIGHLPDPRAYDARAERAGFVLRTVLQLVCCAVPVILAWAVLA